MNNRLVLFALGVLALPLLLAMLSVGGEPTGRSGTLTYSEFLDDVNNNAIQAVTIDGTDIRGTRADGTSFRTVSPGDPGLIDDLVNNDVAITATAPSRPSLLGRLLVSLIPILLLVLVFFFVMRRLQGGAGGSGIMSIGKSRARAFDADTVKVTLADVAGVEEARDEVGEIVDFLKHPQRFQAVGGAIPRGVVMVGPPGTGKTLLARAIAGEASVPFFTASGSDFVEMFVGVGASRVRDLFKQAKERAPCIIFVDEIDAVGRRRGAGQGGGNDEREQTLNQLLVEMDGFQGNEGIIVIAATNRPDVLDQALLRPGRFDRQVVVPLPDVRGREQILALHMRKVPVGDDVDARSIARGTPGFSGADLANLVNEAALFAARADRQVVGMDAFERAKDKITMGTERRSMTLSEADRRLTAYHEAGHTIVGQLVPEQDPVHKVSIIPRGRALGVTLFLPERDRFSASKRQLQSQIATLFGGRLAEEIVFGRDAVTTGAQNDIERATAIARDMVTKWGLSQRLGPLAYQEPEGEVFLGQGGAQRKQVSDATTREIETEVRAIVETNSALARQLLLDHREKLDAMAAALMDYETLDADQIKEIMAGRAPTPPTDAAGHVDRGRDVGTGTRGHPTATGIPAAQGFVQQRVAADRED